jgi:hypothetical protein
VEERQVVLTLRSKTALIMDRDNISFAEEIVSWTKDPTNADAQRAGDDRAPAWGWLGRLHHGTDGLVSIPESMLAPCIRGAGAMIPHPTARGGKTLKEQSQSGLSFIETHHPLWLPPDDSDGWHPIVYHELEQKLRQEEDFAQHEAVARRLGFILDVRRAKPQYNRSHVRVRPMFAPWYCVCEVTVTDEVFTDKLVLDLFNLAGTRKGLGNWRPSVGKAGPFGQFTALGGVPADLAAARKGWVKA